MQNRRMRSTQKDRIVKGHEMCLCRALGYFSLG